VFDHAGQVTGGLSISVPATRFDSAAPARLGVQVRAAAEDLSRRLGWSGIADRSGVHADFPVQPRAAAPMPRGAGTVTR
jgi:IclR family acetate operon transcriptional repressor